MVWDTILGEKAKYIEANCSMRSEGGGEWDRRRLDVDVDVEVNVGEKIKVDWKVTADKGKMKWFG